MQSPQETANRIKTKAKENEISVSKLLTDCDLNKNSLFTMQSGGYYPRVEAIVKMADYLNCSVDYLLGRTDDPNVEKTSAAAQDEQQRELLALFDKLPESEKMKLIGRLEYMAEAAAKEAEQKNSSALYKYSSIAAEGGELSKSAKKKPKTTL